jgi:hypothetical protein
MSPEHPLAVGVFTRAIDLASSPICTNAAIRGLRRWGTVERQGFR